MSERLDDDQLDHDADLSMAIDEAHRAREQESRAIRIVAGLKNEHCWCPDAIVRRETHTDLCDEATAFVSGVVANDEAAQSISYRTGLYTLKDVTWERKNVRAWCVQEVRGLIQKITVAFIIYTDPVKVAQDALKAAADRLESLSI